MLNKPRLPNTHSMGVNLEGDIFLSQMRYIRCNIIASFEFCTSSVPIDALSICFDTKSNHDQSWMSRSAD